MSEVASLREIIARCAMRYARDNAVPFYLSLGTPPTVMFLPYADNTLHGNFLPATYRAILGNEAWRKRLHKRHQRANVLPAERRATARELDSSHSSDALLMNVFCYPGIAKCEPLARLFHLKELPTPEFGVRGNVPLNDGTVDATEVDMRLGGILVEAKLVEGDFTSKAKDVVEAYRDLRKVFRTKALPQWEDAYYNYQLIRHVLAVHAARASSYVIIDERRPNLRLAWEDVIEAIKPADLHSRCHLLYWQHIAAVVPDELRAFLAAKYGIVARGAVGQD